MTKDKNVKLPYPTITKYQLSLRNPAIAFHKVDPQTKQKKVLDSILVNGNPVPNHTGTGLWSSAGGFACVFKYQTQSPQKFWAVRCFKQSSSTIETRYQNITSKLKNITCSQYFIEFQYLKNGISVEGNTYPIVRMEWADGKTLKEFIEDNLKNATKLQELTDAWVKLSQDLCSEGICHGDLQHGNILVNDSGQSISIKLIDYDSLYFTSDGANVKDEIKGIPDYQHRGRQSIKFQCINVDFVSELIIYISLIVLSSFPDTWQIYKLDNAERLLFSKEDLENPAQSQTFFELAQMSPNIATLVKKLSDICQNNDISTIPPLADLINPANAKWDAVKSQSLNQSKSQSSSTQTVSWTPSGSPSNISQPVQTVQWDSTKSIQAAPQIPSTLGQLLPNPTSIVTSKKKTESSNGCLLYITIVLFLSNAFFSFQFFQVQSKYDLLKNRLEQPRP
jgi:Protein kinase domain